MFLIQMRLDRVPALFLFTFLSTRIFAFNLVGAELPMPSNLPGEWSGIGRTNVQIMTDSAIIQNGFIVDTQVWTDVEMSFRARVPTNTDEVQIWGGIRFRDRDSRYVFALRGGNDNDVYLARYAPDGGSEFLGFAPLDFHPVPGQWYSLRVVAFKNRFLIYVNNEKLPRINVVDQTALWDQGSICLGGGWLPVEFADLRANSLTSEETSAILAIGDRRWEPPAVDKDVLRRNQRAQYEPEVITDLGPGRSEYSLNGDWLFSPDDEVPAGQIPVQPDYNDFNWHVMPVPAFWTPGLAWLYGEIGFPNLDEFSKTKGVADSLYVQEIKRCDAYTFDWRQTHAAWYRHYINLPADLGHKRFELDFDAIAKVSAIWVNGIKVGEHTGMFSEIKCDITKAVRPGRNVITVHVIDELDSHKDTSNKIEGVAVTEPVTSAMLHSLPHGMFQDDVGGIWQPVKLTVTSPTLVQDVFVEPNLHGAKISIAVLNTGAEPANLAISYTITSTRDKSVLYAATPSAPVLIDSDSTNHLTLQTPFLNPLLWSPEDPNLYNLEIRLTEQNQQIDNYNVRFGFRTFTVDGSKFLLNGRPFWLRGANPFPEPLRPNDAKLAAKFISKARQGNVLVTRTHITPFTSTWLDAADEGGMAVSFEGTWPWLMLTGKPPDEALIKAWRNEFISLIHEYRNHPGIVLWTVNNEMKFEQFNQNDPALLEEKWQILNATVKEMRQTDPTRPIAADSSYVRKEALRGYNAIVKRNNFDDGDVDDTHRYFGWYNDSFFHLYDGQYNKESTSDRPFISQEMSTGYPNNDDGHPVRFYLFKHYTPQALVGDDAYENADPTLFLKRQAFMTKELAETLRRNSHEKSAGALLFSYITWFQTPWSYSGIKPWLTYDALKTALQPVLVSAELYGRHFFAGSTIHRRVCIVNDAENGDALPNSELIWEFKYDGQVLAQGKVNVPPVKYYGNEWLNVDFRVPQNLPLPKIDAQLVLRLEANGTLLSENNYDVTLATADWTEGDLDRNTKIQLWDPRNQSVKTLFGLPARVISSLSMADPSNVLVVGSLKGVTLTPAQLSQLRSFVSQGGNVLMLHPGSVLPALFPEQVVAFKPKQGEIVTMRVPESPVFSGIEPLDLAWFEQGHRRVPMACTGVFQIPSSHPGVVPLAWQCDIHGYLKNTADVDKISGYPLLELQLNKGKLLASEMCLESGSDDPIARRLLINSIRYLTAKE